MDAESGTIVIYNEEDATGYSKRLAEICLDEMCGILGSYRGGIAKNKKDVRIVKNSEVPVILIEVGYMSNRQELELLNSPEYQKMAAQAIYQTIQKGVEEGIGTENE